MRAAHEEALEEGLGRSAVATLMEPSGSAGDDVVDDEFLIAEIKRRLPRGGGPEQGLSPRINTCVLLWHSLVILLSSLSRPHKGMQVSSTVRLSRATKPGRGSTHTVNH